MGSRLNIPWETMRNILVLGAGYSAPYLIHYLLTHAQALEARVIVADRDGAAAAKAVGDHPHGHALTLDIGDTEQRRREITAADIVVNLLPPAFQALVARDCIDQSTHMVSASYKASELDRLARDAERAGVLVLCEVGLDPGIDLMTACSIIRRVQGAGGQVRRFYSYGGGLPAPGPALNPLRYAITWNPRNVVMSAEAGAEYLENGLVRIVPWHRVFRTTWPVDVPALGVMEAYPNRDSLSYRETLSLGGVDTLVRGTLRYPGWSEVWHQVVRLGLPNERVMIPDLPHLTYAQLVEMCLPPGSGNGDLRQRTALFLGLNPTGKVMAGLEWLGLFAEEEIGAPARTPAEAIIRLLQEKLALPADAADMVVLHHVLDVTYPQEERQERVLSTFEHRGEPGGFTAMATTVGLPTGIATRLILEGTLDMAGCLIPTQPAIYEPILTALEAEGLRFREETRHLGGSASAP